MKIINYQSPDMRIMSVYSEGCLCTSQEGGNALELPDVTWKDEVEW